MVIGKAATLGVTIGDEVKFFSEHFFEVGVSGRLSLAAVFLELV